MMVFFSCGDSLNRAEIFADAFEIDATTPRQLIDILEERQSGWRARLLRPDGSLRSDVALYIGMVQHAQGRWLDDNRTRVVHSLDEPFGADDTNLLVSLFRPDEIVHFLLENLAGEAPPMERRVEHER